MGESLSLMSGRESIAFDGEIGAPDFADFGDAKPCKLFGGLLIGESKRVLLMLLVGEGERTGR